MDRYETLEVIGRGSFSTVRRVRRISDGCVLCMKEIDYRKMSTQEKASIVNILRDLNHPYIVKYVDRVIDKSRGVIYIFMDYCGGGDLAHMIKRCKAENLTMSEPVIWKFLYQLLLALDECHSTTDKHIQILHRDIKPENVLLDNNHNVRLGDFGLSKAQNAQAFAQTYAGSPFYMSPEMYNEKSDVWSLGCLIHELTTLEPPFQARTQLALTTRIKQGFVQDIPNNFSRELNAIIKCMLTTNYTERPSASFLLKCKLMQDHRDSLEPAQKIFSESTSSQHTIVSLKADESQQHSRELALNERESRLNLIENALNNRESLLNITSAELCERKRCVAAASAKLAQDTASFNAMLAHHAAQAQRQNTRTPIQLREKENIKSRLNESMQMDVSSPSPARTKWLRARNQEAVSVSNGTSPRSMMDYTQASPVSKGREAFMQPPFRHNFSAYRGGSGSGLSSANGTPVRCVRREEGSPMSITESPVRSQSPVGRMGYPRTLASQIPPMRRRE